MLEFTNNKEKPYKIIPAFATYFGGNRAEATVEMINQVIRNFNASQGNQPLSFFYRMTEPMGVPSIGLDLVKANTGVGAVGAACDCCGCSYKFGESCVGDDGITLENNQCSNPGISANRTALGTYLFDLAPVAAPETFSQFFLRFGNFKQLGIIASVTRVSPSQFEVVTYSTIAGTAVDALDGNFAEVLVWA